VPAVGPLRPGEEAAAARVLARAFLDTPLNRAVYEGRGARFRERANTAGMRALLEVAGSHGLVLAAGEPGRLAGALVAVPPGAFPLPLPPPRVRLRTLWHQGFRAARRWAAASRALGRAHRVGFHWYLAILGVEPARQGRGLGRALLERFLAAVDAAGEAAYLETDRAENVPFYTGAGFRVRERVCVLGVPVWLLHRPGATPKPPGPRRADRDGLD